MNYKYILLLVAGNSYALGLEDLKFDLPDTIQIHGFASQSYIHTSDNNFLGHSSNMGSLDFTEMGINGSWKILPKLQTSMQVVYRRAGATDGQYVRIDYGFADYSFVSKPNELIGVRAGRVINPFGLYNDTRDMPFTRPSIFLPQSIYFDINRNFALSGDGVQVYGEKFTDYGDFHLQVNGIYPRVDDPEWHPTLGTDKLRSEPSWIGRLMYEWDRGRIRLGITSSDLYITYALRNSSRLDQPFNFHSVLFSAQYNAEDFSLTGEYAIRGASVGQERGLLMNTIGESYYVQGAYRFTPNIEAYTRYDLYFPDREDRNGEKFQAKTGLPAYLNYAKDLTAGVRWDINSYSMVRAEYHYVEGTSWLSFIENKDLFNQSKYWSMWALSVSFRF